MAIAAQLAQTSVQWEIVVNLECGNTLGPAETLAAFEGDLAAAQKKAKELAEEQGIKKSMGHYVMICPIDDGGKRACPAWGCAEDFQGGWGGFSPSITLDDSAA